LYKKFPTYYGSIVCNASILTSIDDMDVLIIEDSESTASLLSDYLKQLNYKEIHTCKDGKSGINKFLELSSSNRLPLVFLDYFLPDMGAISVFDELIKAQPKAKIVIATVAGKGEDGINYLIEHGAYHYLQKPFSFRNLKEVMNTYEKEREFAL